MLVAAGAALAGCGGGPSQVGAAAIVGSHVVSLADTQRRVDEALAKPELLRQLQQQNGKPADISREVISREVQHLLLTEEARRESVTVADQQVDAELARQGGADALAAVSIYDATTVREAIRDQLVAQQLARKLLGRLSVTIDLTTAGSRAEAVAKARQLAAGPKQAAAVLAADGPKAQRGVQLRAALIPQWAASFLFGTQAGTVVAAQTSPAPDGWSVLRVTKRSTSAPPVNATAALSQLDDQTLDDIGRRLTQPLAEQLGVRVSPRYGTWDPLRLAVLGPEVPVGLVLPAALT